MRLSKIKPSNLKPLLPILVRAVVLTVIGYYFVSKVMLPPDIIEKTCYTDAGNQIYYVTEVSKNTVIYVKTIESYYNTYTERVVAAKGFLQMQVKDQVIFEIDCDALSSSTRELLRKATYE